MAVRARALARRNFRHHDAERFAMTADAGIDDIGEIAHRRRLENQILLPDQYFALPPELFFMHRESHLFCIHFSRAVARGLPVIELRTAARNQRLARVFALLSVDPEFRKTLIFINRLAESQRQWAGGG